MFPGKVLKVENHDKVRGKAMKPAFIKKLVKVILIIAVIAFIACTYIWIQGQPDTDLACTQEYVPGTSNIKGDVDKDTWESRGEAFAIGANKDGYAVFKNPREAMNTICRDYGDGIKALRKAGAPWCFRLNYPAYISYDEAVPTDSKDREQATIVAGFVDIYENSFEPYD